MENKVTEIIIFAAGFMIGSALGWFAHKIISKKNMDNWERAFISVVVTIVWVISVLFDIAVASYDTPIAVHAVMGLVAGYFFEGSILDVISKR